MKHYLALDFGGTAVKCAVMNTLGKIEKQFSVSSQARYYEQWISAFAPHFAQLNSQYDLQGIAISSCGAVDVDSSVIHGSSALPYIHGPNVRALFQSAFGLPTEIENDACCAALAESWFGEGSDSNHFCLLVIGSGLGGAIVTNGQVQKGHQLHGGEFGYAVVDFKNYEPITLGNVASTRALVNYAADALQCSPASLNGLKVFELFDAGEPKIINVVEQWARYLATGIYNIQYHIDPECIILGGAISQRPGLLGLLHRQLEHIYQAIPIAQVRPQLTISRFGNDANLIGALRHFFIRQGC
ncbi:ROK family protein [Vibrio sp. SM6]|uniref:ROK family protein n=1 Tax=Vibrio agarilyticus TaxID=2726741 RepID=A0A7X8TPG4_9VIBR|nr:ROK family protein [Vibrio agarilyticus]NLS12515.1 ROK family protein [Vibrio agarilyticus]